jgi:hypothetical protein
MLRTVANQFASIFELALDIEATNLDVTSGWHNVPG